MKNVEENLENRSVSLGSANLNPFTPCSLGFIQLSKTREMHALSSLINRIVRVFREITVVPVPVPQKRSSYAGAGV